MMDRFLRLMVTGLDTMAAFLFACALLINVGNVIGRYVFHAPLFWAEEVTTLLVIWSIALLSFRLTARGEHLVTDVLRVFLPEHLQRALLVLVNVFVLVFVSYLAWQSYLVVDMVGRYGQVTTVAELPKSVANGAILTLFVLAALGAVVRLMQVMNQARPLPTTAPTEVAELLATPEASK